MSKMATSLAEQLQRLKTPQTQLLVDRKKRPSILFDEKEAAEKDRETIFDIGYNGFQDLLKLNPTFLQFESSLFDKNARELQRAVESEKVNAQLNDVIKKFLIHLSPYLLLQPTHKCLEWLIRRFNINEYNKDEMMMLILPYHESKIFVRCVQTMRFGPHDKWFWLKPIQENGVPLSKQALLNRTAHDTYLLSFICNSVCYAVDMLPSRLHTLQVYYAFFCTSVIGALDIANINESHVTKTYGAIKQGLKSESIDFCAASLMIVGQLVNKVRLRQKILDKIVTKLIGNVSHAKLQPDVIILLVLIYRNQNDSIHEIPVDVFPNILHMKWIPSVLTTIYNEGVDILPFYLPLLSACLKKIQMKGDHWKACRKFCDILISECFFRTEDADKVIRCTLESFITTGEKLNDSVIEIESGGEDDKMTANEDKQITKWYTNTLKSFEQRYSSTFDGIVKDIIRSDNKSMSELKKKSLKKVLSFLFSIVCTDDNVNLFEKLYHYSAQHRIEAVTFLVKNLEKLSFSDDSKTLLKNSIAERLADDSPLVVKEALKFNNKALLKFIGQIALQKKLNHILDKTLQKPSVWAHAGLGAIKHLTKLCTKKTAIDILVTVLPFLLQPTGLSTDFLQQILCDELASHSAFIRNCKNAIKSADKDTIAKHILAEFETRKGLPQAAQVLAHIKSIPAEDLTLNKSFYSMLLLSYAIDKSLNCETATEILNIIQQNESQYAMVFVKDSSKWGVHVAMGSYPINLNIVCIRNIIDAIRFNELRKNPIDFSKSTPIISLLQNIFNYFAVTMSQSLMKKEIYELIDNQMRHSLNDIFQTANKRIEFLSNYFVLDLLEQCEPTDEKLHIFMIKYFNAILESDDTYSMDLMSFIRILSALRSKNATVRESTFDTLSMYNQVPKSKYSTLIGKLMKRQSEILMDDNQLSLIIFTIFKKKSSPDLSANLSEFIEFISNAKESEFLVSLLLEVLVHVNNEDILQSIADTATKLLTKTTTADTSVQLDGYKSTIVRNILSRFTHQTIKIVQKSPNAWQLLTKCAESYEIFLKWESNQISVSSVLVSLFDNDLFAKLSAQHQSQLISSLVHSGTYSENVDLYSAIRKFIKQIRLSAETSVNILNEMAQAQNIEPMEIDEEMPSERQRQNSMSAKQLATAPSEVFRSKAWKCGVTWLEFLQHKRNISDNHLLMAPLFGVLQKCLQFEDQSGFEYVKQLILGLLHHLCATISPNGEKNDLISESTFKIEPVVKCIRGTQNPQTHHHALQLLSHSAKMLPDQVLHNMMDIFTFMGSSVVRHDDAYSFQIITNIIESIIPTLTRANESRTQSKRKELVVPVLKVFCDIVLDVPEHRRLPLYTKLLDTLGANEYLWMFLIILIESHVTHPANETEKLSSHLLALNVESPQRIGIALALTKEFDCKTIMITVTHLIKFLQKLPINKPESDDSDKLSTDTLSLVNVDAVSRKEFRHFKYEVIRFVNTMTSSVEFVNKVAVLTEDETKSMKERYQNAIISILTYIPVVSKTIETTTDHAQYWKVSLHNCFDILENFIALLSSNLLLVVVEGLLSHKLSSVRRRVLELLIQKLQYKSDIFVEENIPQLVSLLDPLTNIIESIVDEKKQMQTASSTENVGIQQMALMTIKLLSKQLAEKNPKHFKVIVETLIGILRKNEIVPRILLAIVILCLCEVCSNLRVHSIPYFPLFMKILLEILEIQSNSSNANSDNVLICLVSGLQKIVFTLALYLSPYLVDLIVRLSVIWYNLEKESTKDAKRHPAIIERLNGIWEKLSTVLELRILIPSIDQSYKLIVQDKKSKAIGPIMKLLSQSIQHQSPSTITSFMPDITSLFIKALQFRSDYRNTKQSKLNQLEDQVIKAFSTLTLKLSEGSFRPLYHRTYEWAIKQSDYDIDKTITFFRLSTEIAKALKSLFVLFAGDFIDDAATLLKKSADTESVNRQKMALMIQSVVETLYQVFFHDSRGFINGMRFDILVQPLVDLIENDIVLGIPTLMGSISTCLAQLGIAINDDIQWKQLNYQILLKTRNNESNVRLFALRVCVELASKLGEDYMSLLPETVPFISELLEDDNPEVGKQCQRSVQELEKILGEPLQKYF